MGLGQSPSLLAGFAKLTFRQQIAKGLVVRSDQRGYDAVGKIVDFFHDPVLGGDAAAALGVVADEGDRVISKENYAVIRVRPASFVSPIRKLMRSWILYSCCTSSASLRSCSRSSSAGTRPPRAPTRECISWRFHASSCISLARSPSRNFPKYVTCSLGGI